MAPTESKPPGVSRLTGRTNTSPDLMSLTEWLIAVGVTIWLAAFVALIVLGIREGMRDGTLNLPMFKPVFDRERRELRYGREAPIAFCDIEVRVFSYHVEEETDSPRATAGSEVALVKNLFTAMQSGIEHLHRVYVRAGDRRVDLKEFGSAKEAEQYANQIRRIIADAGNADDRSG